MSVFHATSILNMNQYFQNAFFSMQNDGRKLPIWKFNLIKCILYSYTNEIRSKFMYELKDRMSEVFHTYSGTIKI
jgi:hypothetical protein